MTMKFVSTRGVGDDRRRYSFEEAVLLGWAEDGGMILPETLPQITPEKFLEWKPLSYSALCQEILKLFIGEEIPEAKLAEIIVESFARFGCDGVVRLHPLQLNSVSSRLDFLPFVNPITHSHAIGLFLSSFYFSQPISTNLKQSQTDPQHSLHICELYHGPTLAFKDLGMQVLVNCLSFFLGRRNQVQTPCFRIGLIDLLSINSV